MTRLEQLRLDAGLTRQQLSAETDVHGTTITRIEEGERTTPKTLVKLARFFAVRPSELQQLVDEPERSAA